MSFRKIKVLRNNVSAHDYNFRHDLVAGHVYKLNILAILLGNVTYETRNGQQSIPKKDILFLDSKFLDIEKIRNVVEYSPLRTFVRSQNG